MADARIDHRPEGGILLSALLIGRWNEACHIAVCAAAAGYAVDIDSGYVPGAYPIPHYFIKTGEENETN